MAPEIRRQLVCGRCGPIGAAEGRALGETEPCVNDCGGTATVTEAPAPTVTTIPIMSITDALRVMQRVDAGGEATPAEMEAVQALMGKVRP